MDARKRSVSGATSYGTVVTMSDDNGKWRGVEIVSKIRGMNRTVNGYIILEQHSETGEYRKRTVQDIDSVE